MAVIVLRRAAYRVRQFLRAVTAYLAPLNAAERAEAHAALPEPARPLFDAMPRNDQRHSLAVLRTLRTAGHNETALLQAALLHDAAKAAAGLTLLHRVAIVLLKAFRPQILRAWAVLPQPPRPDLRYPFWAHANHPAAGADMAAGAGCDPVAVLLIRRHQEPVALSGATHADENQAHRNRGFSRFPSLRDRPAKASTPAEHAAIPQPGPQPLMGSPCEGLLPSDWDFQPLNSLLAALQAADDDN